jgi:hypothetical protein
MTLDAPLVGQNRFSAVSAVTPYEPGHFSAELDPAWTIGGKPNGGYLLAVLARAATSMGAHQHATAVSAHYLHSPEPGQVLIETEILRAGRSASQIRARMAQDGQACVEALITATQLPHESTPQWGLRPAGQAVEESYMDGSPSLMTKPSTPPRWSSRWTRSHRLHSTSSFPVGCRPWS